MPGGKREQVRRALAEGRVVFGGKSPGPDWVGIPSPEPLGDVLTAGDTIWVQRPAGAPQRVKAKGGQMLTIPAAGPAAPVRGEDAATSLFQEAAGGGKPKAGPRSEAAATEAFTRGASEAVPERKIFEGVGATGPQFDPITAGISSIFVNPFGLGNELTRGYGEVAEMFGKPEGYGESLEREYEEGLAAMHEQQPVASGVGQVIGDLPLMLAGGGSVGAKAALAPVRGWLARAGMTGAKAAAPSALRGAAEGHGTERLLGAGVGAGLGFLGGAGASAVGSGVQSARRAAAPYVQLADELPVVGRWVKAMRKAKAARRAGQGLPSPEAPGGYGSVRDEARAAQARAQGPAWVDDELRPTLLSPKRGDKWGGQGLWADDEAQTLINLERRAPGPVARTEMIPKPPSPLPEYDPMDAYVKRIMEQPRGAVPQYGPSPSRPDLYGPVENLPPGLRRMKFEHDLQMLKEAAAARGANPTVRVKP